MSRSPVVAGLAMFVVGAVWVWMMTTLNAIVQLASPAWVRGRVIALFVLVVATKPIGAALAGLIAELAGVPWALALAGSTTVLIGLIARRYPLSRVVAAEWSPPAVSQRVIKPSWIDGSFSVAPAARCGCRRRRRPPES